MNHIYSATFSGVAATAAQDVFELVAPANARLTIRKIVLGQYSDFGDAQAEILSVTVLRGHTTSGSGGSTPTPASMNGYAPPSAATVEANNTTVASGGSPETLIADTMNVASGWFHEPPPEERISIKDGERLVVRINAPADEITINGTVVFEETPPLHA